MENKSCTFYIHEVCDLTGRESGTVTGPPSLVGSSDIKQLFWPVIWPAAPCGRRGEALSVSWAGTRGRPPSGVYVDRGDVTQAVAKGPIGEEATVLRATGYQVFRWLWWQFCRAWDFSQGPVACGQMAEQGEWMAKVGLRVFSALGPSKPIWGLVLTCSLHGPADGEAGDWVGRSPWRTRWIYWLGAALLQKRWKDGWGRTPSTLRGHHPLAEGLSPLSFYFLPSYQTERHPKARQDLVSDHLKIIYYFFMCTSVLPACTLVHQCRAMPRRSEDGVGFPWNWR